MSKVLPTNRFELDSKEIVEIKEKDNENSPIKSSRRMSNSFLSYEEEMRDQVTQPLPSQRKPLSSNNIAGEVKITLDEIELINRAQSANENKEELIKLGGQNGLAGLLGLNLETGLTTDQVENLGNLFGYNRFPEVPMKGFWRLFIESFDDTTLIVLICAAIVSLIVGSIEDPGHGWIEGVAILIAVLIVAFVTAGNDYTKELQFRELEESSRQDERCSVLRNNELIRISPDDLVIGDIINLSMGDGIPADGVIIQGKNVKSKESSLTGESEDVLKSVDGDPFLLSSCTITDVGTSQYLRMIVIGVGPNSQWGKIRETLVKPPSATPLQEKLDYMAKLIGYIGTVAAFATFIVLIIMIWARYNGKDILLHIIDAFIIAITIIVVAIPEGLPLAVTISLAYSTKKMYKDQNLIRVLAACETMGNATNICSDKTGTLTENRMTVVEGWIAGQRYSQDEFHSKLPSNITSNIRNIIGYNCCVNSSAHLIWEELGKKDGHGGGILESRRNFKRRTLSKKHIELAGSRPMSPNSEPSHLSARSGKSSKSLIEEEKIATHIEENMFQAAKESSSKNNNPKSIMRALSSFSINKEEEEEKKIKRRPKVVGNATEGALLLMADHWGLDWAEVRTTLFKPIEDRQFPFNSDKKRSTVIIRNHDESVRLYCKGASEMVLADSSSYLDSDGQIKELTNEVRNDIENYLQMMANNALRTLCIAHRDFKHFKDLPKDWETNPPDYEKLTCDAIVGIMDPLRDDVKDAVNQAQNAGVTVRMVTGDNLHTACAIARQCGILTENGIALEGPQFRQMTPSELDKILPNLQVLARSSPEDKYLLVTRLNGVGLPKTQEEWEKIHHEKNLTWENDRDNVLPGYKEEWIKSRPTGGEVVGVTGDGTNDGPALKAADVGLSMGLTGTQVAKDASDIVILDDRFSSIVKAIMWGRSVYDNIRKFLQFQLTVNVVALSIVFIGSVAGFDPPLNAVMMLWVNLIMDTMGALALGTEEPTKELLERRPYKRNASLISRPMWRNILFQSAFQLILLIILLFEGDEYFDVESGNVCQRYDTTSNSNLWDSTTQKKSGGGTISCSTFETGLIGDLTNYPACGTTDNGKCFRESEWSELKDFEDDCLSCESWNYVHFTILFNAFVFCQLFNEFNARNIFDEINCFKGLSKNKIFIAIIFLTIGMQIFIVEIGGDFTRTSSLTVKQWLITIALGAIALPIGVIMRFFPIKEDPESMA